MHQPRSQIIGKVLSEIPSPIQYLAAKYRAIHIKLLEHNNSTEYINLIEQGENILVIRNKVHVIVKHNLPIGLFIKAEEIKPFNDFSLGYRALRSSIGNLKLEQNIIYPHNHLNNYKIKLSSREELILFLITIGKQEKEIANILSIIYNELITREAISKLISRNLYTKLNVWNRSNLIEKSLELNILKQFPLLLIKKLHLVSKWL